MFFVESKMVMTNSPSIVFLFDWRICVSLIVFYLFKLNKYLMYFYGTDWHISATQHIIEYFLDI